MMHGTTNIKLNIFAFLAKGNLVSCPQQTEDFLLPFGVRSLIVHPTIQNVCVWNSFTLCETSTLIVSEEPIVRVVEKKPLKEHLYARGGR